jgi:hypothetical protein
MRTTVIAPYLTLMGGAALAQVTLNSVRIRRRTPWRWQKPTRTAFGMRRSTDRFTGRT